jgi:predicted outer membrane protein
MRRVAVLTCLAFWVVSCGRSRPATNQAASTPESFLTSAYLAASGDADVCALATRQARLPETRELGAALHRTLISMRTDLANVARRRRVSLPNGLEERKLALKDNLSILPGRIFDQGYALAMVQDTRAMLQGFDAASRVNDPDVRNIIAKYQQQIRERQRDSDRLLSRLGGAPWPAFEP